MFSVSSSVTVVPLLDARQLLLLLVRTLTYLELKLFPLITFYNPSMALQTLWTAAAFSVSRSYTQSVELFGRGISPLQGLYLHRTT
jgi:hypothetical protein